MNKTMIIGTVVLILLAVAVYFMADYNPCPDAYIAGYSVSEDGTDITLDMDTVSSAMYVHKVTVHQQESGKLYLNCYYTVKESDTSFTIELDEDTETIALYRGENAYEVMLEKDSEGSWQRVK